MKKKINQDTEAMGDLFNLCVKEIRDVLTRKATMTDITRLAAATLSNYTRLKSTEIHDKAIELMMTRKDIKQLPDL